MLTLFAAPAHDRRLIPEGRLSGPMPWVIAIMIFLTVLASAAGLALAEAAGGVSDRLAAQVTVQVIEADPATRDARAEAIADRLRANRATRTVRRLPAEEIDALIEPWLGEGRPGNESARIGEDIPVPALIDVELRGPANEAALAGLRADLSGALGDGDVRIEPASGYIAPVIALTRSLQWIAAALVALLSLATAAAVIISARAALNTHKDTIGVIHLLGGTDRQITRLFQRRIALDALLGGLVGLLFGIGVIWLLSMQVGALQSGLVDALGLSWFSWLVILAIPFLGMGLAMATARVTVMGALKKIL